MIFFGFLEKLHFRADLWFLVTFCGMKQRKSLHYTCRYASLHLSSFWCIFLIGVSYFFWFFNRHFCEKLRMVVQTKIILIGCCIQPSFAQPPPANPFFVEPAEPFRTMPQNIGRFGRKWFPKLLGRKDSMCLCPFFLQTVCGRFTLTSRFFFFAGIQNSVLLKKSLGVPLRCGGDRHKLFPPPCFVTPCRPPPAVSLLMADTLAALHCALADLQHRPAHWWCEDVACARQFLPYFGLRERCVCVLAIVCRWHGCDLISFGSSRMSPFSIYLPKVLPRYGNFRHSWRHLIWLGELLSFLGVWVLKPGIRGIFSLKLKKSPKKAMCTNTFMANVKFSIPMG